MLIALSQCIANIYLLELTGKYKYNTTCGANLRENFGASPLDAAISSVLVNKQ